MKEKKEPMTIEPERVELYADTYRRLYLQNRQEASDYITHLRRLLTKDIVLAVLQKAAEKSLAIYSGYATA